jgi:flagellar motor switch protein FliM
VFALGSGAVEVSCEAIGLYAIVDSGVWRDVSPRERGASAHRSKLTPLDQAAQRSRLRLDVHLGTADVEVLQLLDMRPGDVLRLSQRLTDGISLLCAGQTIARGALGERHGRKALQLLTTNGSTGA